MEQAIKECIANKDESDLDESNQDESDQVESDQDESGQSESDQDETKIKKEVKTELELLEQDINAQPKIRMPKCFPCVLACYSVTTNLY